MVLEQSRQSPFSPPSCRFPPENLLDHCMIHRPQRLPNWLRCGCLEEIVLHKCSRILGAGCVSFPLDFTGMKCRLSGSHRLLHGLGKESAATQGSGFRAASTVCQERAHGQGPREYQAACYPPISLERQAQFNPMNFVSPIRPEHPINPVYTPWALKNPIVR